MQVEHEAVGRGKVLNQCDQFLVQHGIVGGLTIILVFPHVFGYRIGMGIVHFLSHVINGRIDDDPSDPADEEHFDFFLIADLETAEIPKHFQKGVMGDFGRLFVGMNIPERDLQTQAIVLVVQQFLALPLLLRATFDYIK